MSEQSERVCSKCGCRIYFERGHTDAICQIAQRQGKIDCLQAVYERDAEGGYLIMLPDGTVAHTSSKRGISNVVKRWALGRGKSSVIKIITFEDEEAKIR